MLTFYCVYKLMPDLAGDVMWRPRDLFLVSCSYNPTRRIRMGVLGGSNTPPPPWVRLFRFFFLGGRGRIACLSKRWEMYEDTPIYHYPVFRKSGTPFFRKKLSESPNVYPPPPPIRDFFQDWRHLCPLCLHPIVKHAPPLKKNISCVRH